jgi:hypothetical protein
MMTAVFEARYHGYCPACTDDIETGDRVTYSDQQLIHADCRSKPDPDQPRRTERLCPDCYTWHAGECA